MSGNISIAWAKEYLLAAMF